MWYKRREQPLRHAVWLAAVGFMGLVGTMAVFGIGHIHGHLHSWKYQFLLIGGITVAWGIILFLVLPDSPVEAKFLSKEMRIVAVERMRYERTGIENKVFKPYQVKEAILDPKTWLMAAMVFLTALTNGGISGFGAIIVKGFGFSAFKSILLVGSVSAFIFVWTLSCG